MSDRLVSLVIPGRNCADTVHACLQAVVPLLGGALLREIIFVDDGSTDKTREIVASFPVILLEGEGRGPGAARNLGYRHASHAFVWFVDADCVAEPDALDKLMPEMMDPKVGAVSGSYGNMRPNSLLACLIHEEIVERHRRMRGDVDFLATFNVVYRRDALQKVGGFDERFLKGQDAELSWRVMAAGYRLRFALDSRVKHFHEDRWKTYLRTQKDQGYWRVFLHLSHHGHAAGDSYSNWVDHLQPPVAMMSLVSLPLWLIPPWGAVNAGLLGLLALLQIPMTFRLVRRTRSLRYLFFSGMSMVRAFWRGVGMSRALLQFLFLGKRVNTSRD
jgi:cellulose synthase/poly-beta-1,6-N-acetylglucosamine synthase-like glycosyltransferase